MYAFSERGRLRDHHRRECYRFRREPRSNAACLLASLYQSWSRKSLASFGLAVFIISLLISLDITLYLHGLINYTLLLEIAIFCTAILAAAGCQHEPEQSLESNVLQLKAEAKPVEFLKDIPVDMDPIAVFMSGEPRRSKRLSGSEPKAPGLLAASDTTIPQSSKGKQKASAASDDDFSPAEEENARKKRSVKTSTKPRKKRTTAALSQIDIGSEPAFSDPANAPPGLDLDQLDIVIDHRTPILKKFVDQVKHHGLKVKPGIRHDYTPCFDRATHVLDLPFYDPDHRRYVLLEDQVELYDEVRADESTTRVWRLLAQNQQDDAAAPVPLFVYPTTWMPKKQMTVVPGFNLIEEQHCPEADRPKIIELGKLKVDIMNKFPFRLDVEAWEELPLAPNATVASASMVRRCSYERQFIDLTSLILWKQNHASSFDLRTLQKLAMDKRFYALPTTFNIPKSVKIGYPVAIWCTDLDVQDSRQCQIVVPQAVLDRSKIAQTAAPDETYHLWKLKDDVTVEDDTETADALKVAKLVNLGIVGMIGTRQQIRTYHEDLRMAFTSSGQLSLMGVSTGPGSYNNHPFWSPPTIRKGRAGVFFSLGHKAADNLDMSGLAKLSTTRELTIRELRAELDTHMLSRERIHHAYFIQTALVSLARGDSLLDTILRSKAVAQLIDLGRLTNDDIIALYCHCSAAQREITEHVCMHCHRVRCCHDMGWAETSSGSRFLCPACAGQSFTNRTMISGVSQAIMMMATNAHRYDRQFRAPDWSPRELWTALKSEHEVAGSDHWKDGYSTSQLSYRDAQYAPHLEKKLLCGHFIPHPRQMSLEKPYNRWRSMEGNTNLHHPQNATLTQDCINKLNGHLPPSALPLHKRALELKRQTDTRLPVRGYHEDVKQEWKILERVSPNARIEKSFRLILTYFEAHDNLYMIAQLCPHTLAGRVRQTHTPAGFDRLATMERTGVWDGLVRSSLQDYFRTRGERLRDNTMTPSQKPETQVWSGWTDEEWSVLLNCVGQIEDDHKFFNPAKLTLPRLGRQKIPWLWREDHAPQDLDREFLSNEFRARLRTWDEICDEKNITQESPATLFIECVVQWFQRGGKCHFFGFIMSPFSRHYAAYSFGRAVVVEDKHGNVLRDVKAGEIMRTGCTRLLPKNMEDDYDIERRTVIVESWRSNSLRGNYAGGSSLILMLEACVQSLATQTKWFEPVRPTLEEYTEVIIPSSWRDRASWRQVIRGQNPTITMQEAEELEADVEDEEIALIDQRVTDIQASRDAEFQDEVAAPAGVVTHDMPFDSDAVALPMPGMQLTSGDGSPAVREDPTPAVWPRPTTTAGMDEWEAGHRAFFDGLAVSNEQKQEMERRLTEMLSVARERFEQDAAVSATHT